MHKHELRYAMSMRTQKVCIILDEEVKDPNGKVHVYVKTLDGERFMVPKEMFTDISRFVELSMNEALRAGDVARSEVERCPYCNASMVIYKHTLNKPLVRALQKLDEAGGTANLKTLQLTRNQWDNFQKMKYLDLVEQVADENGQRKKGIWRITDLGHRFVRGEVAIQKSARTYRGEVLERFGPYVQAHYLDDAIGFRKIEDYRADAVGVSS